MKAYKGEIVTEDEHREIILSDIKSNYYLLNSMPRFANDIPTNLVYRESALTNYRERKHKGQYKLYLSEVDFLTDYVRYNSLVIYVGAAAGHHINDLYDNFKHMNLVYHLYDINLFNSELFKKENIKIFNQFFTDEDCLKYKKFSDILFISDIRNSDIANKDLNATNIVFDDMSFQMNWVLKINPRASMLKFRLPYTSDVPVEYLDGEIRLQAYAPDSTTECRLVSEKPFKMKIYIPSDHENRMFYLNKIIRRWYDYDNLLEKYILNKFKKFIKE